MDLSQIGNITESPYNNSGTNYSVENTTFYNDYAYYNYDYFAYPVFLRESLAGMFRKRMYLNLSMVKYNIFFCSEVFLVSARRHLNRF